MDLYQLIGSFVAILLLAASARWLFPSPSTLTKAEIIKDMARYAPDTPFKAPILSTDKKAAILPTKSGKELGLVILLGDQPVCRLITAADRPDFAVNGTQLTLNTHDFTQPPCSLILSETDMEKAQRIVKSVYPEARHAA